MGLVRLPRGSAERDDRRLGLLGERRPLHTGSGKDERAGGRVHALAVELERRAALLDEVELLILVRLVVLVDDPVARVVARPRVDAEGRDAEVVADGSPRTAPVVRFVDLVEVRDRVTTHKTPSIVNFTRATRSRYRRSVSRGGGTGGDVVRGGRSR